MATVLCIVVFFTGSLRNTETVRERGILVKDDTEVWEVDYTEYLSSRPDLKEWNNLVQFVNGDNCLYE